MGVAASRYPFRRADRIGHELLWLCEVTALREFVFALLRTFSMESGRSASHIRGRKQLALHKSGAALGGQIEDLRLTLHAKTSVHLGRKLELC
jgi:hypothetical protein